MKKNVSKVFITYLLLMSITSIGLFAQSDRVLKVLVSPSHADWTYKTSEKAKFDIRILKNNVPLETGKIHYKLSEDTMDPFKEETIQIKNGKATIDAGTMNKSGFIRCIATTTYEGRNYSALATVGFEPEKIKPMAVDPADFDEYWKNAIAQAQKIPLDAKVQLIPEKCTADVNVYNVNIQNDEYGSRIYGILSIPKAPGKYPAILNVPGAGIRPYNPDISRASKGYITFSIGIHGIPIDMNTQVYSDLSRAALRDYWVVNMSDKDKFYYKRVYLGCIRSLDYIFSLDEFNGKDMVVQGGSQGGALSIVTAALDNRVTGLVAFYPALCDLIAYTKGRSGGWPHFLKVEKNRLPQAIETAGYYDVVNFAKRLQVPGFYSFGYNDQTCPPTSMYAAYNSITSPKELYLIPDLGHEGIGELWNESTKWIDKFVKGK